MAGDVQRAAGFQRYRVAGVAQGGQQRLAGLLRQRLAAGDADLARAMLRHLDQHVAERQGLAAGKGVVGVAPGTAQRTAGQPYEYRRQAGTGAFALQGMEDFADAQLG